MSVNMAYCRFRNTRKAMSECIEALEMCEEMSEEEYKACKDMFSEIFTFLVDEGVEIDADTAGEWMDRLADNVEE